MNTFVVQEQLDERASSTPRCPYCESKKLFNHGGRRTLLGGGDGTPDGDPNHMWVSYQCEACKRSFTRETKSGNVWYTNHDNMVLRGMPSCFETYKYTHRNCGGEVTRRHTMLDGKTEAYALSWTAEKGKQWRTFFTCGKCGETIETPGNNPNGTIEPGEIL